MPKISVLLSAFNAGDTLAPALRSLQTQTLTDWECIAVNDGSSDNTFAFLESTAKSDSRFRLIHHDKPRGLTLSLIEASKTATGDYLARQDADDWSDPERFEKQLEVFDADPQCILVGSSMAVHFPNGEPLDVVQAPESPDSLFRILKRRNPLAHGSLLIRRLVFERVGGYRAQFRFAQDYDLLLRLAEVGPLRARHEPLYHHRLSAGGIGRAKRVQQADFADLARRCANARRNSQPEEPLWNNFKESAVGTPDLGVDPILIHLVKAGKTTEAKQRLDHWTPQTTRGRLMKSALYALNKAPSPVRQSLLTAYRMWQLR